MFFGGFFLGGGGLSGMALLRWNQDATQPVEEDKQSRRRRKLEAKLAAHEDSSAACSGSLHRWVGWDASWWLPHWQLAEAEVRGKLLLLRGLDPRAQAAGVSFGEGPKCIAMPLVGATVTTDKQDHSISITNSSGESEHLRVPTSEAQARWVQALKGGANALLSARRRVVEVDFPPTWEVRPAENRSLNRSQEELALPPRTERAVSPPGSAVPCL